MQPEWDQVPAQRSPEWLLRLKVRLALGLLLAAAVAGVASTVSNFLTEPAPVAIPPEPQGRAFAEIAARDFLTANPTALPTAEGVNARWHAPPSTEEDPRGPLRVSRLAWDGFELSTGFGTGRYELHRFVLLSGSYSYRMTVTVRLTSAGPVLGAQPTLEPLLTAASDEYARVDWQDFDQVSVGAPVKRAVADWAAAYAANDGHALKSATGDARIGVSYVGLGGFTAEDTSVRSAVAADDGQVLIVRVRVLLSSANGFKASNEFDLLIGAYDTDRPTVQAWGPAGSAPQLDTYINAVTTTNG